MKVTVVKNYDESKQKDYSIVYSVIMLCLGIVLFLDANKVVTVIFDILGVLIIMFGVYRFSYYERMKNQFNALDGNALVSGVSSIAIGLLIILLSSILSNAISIVTGIWLFFIGISKLNNALTFKDSEKKLFVKDMLGAILFLLLGIYSIFASNAVFTIIGVVLIITAGYDLYKYFLKKNKR